MWTHTYDIYKHLRHLILAVWEIIYSASYLVNDSVKLVLCPLANQVWLGSWTTSPYSIKFQQSHAHYVEPSSYSDRGVYKSFIQNRGWKRVCSAKEQMCSIMLTLQGSLTKDPKPQATQSSTDEFAIVNWSQGESTQISTVGNKPLNPLRN